jgi:phosphate starvation-inducible membrane PsiE
MSLCRNQKREMGLAMMLFCVVIVFFLCNPIFTWMSLCRNQKREMGLAMMLFCVVIVFFLCNLLALIVNILEVRPKFRQNRFLRIFSPIFVF